MTGLRADFRGVQNQPTATASSADHDDSQVPDTADKKLPVQKKKVPAGSDGGHDNDNDDDDGGRSNESGSESESENFSSDGDGEGPSHPHIPGYETMTKQV